MRLERTDCERVCDDAVLLYLWAGAQKATGDAAGGKLKLTKLAFIVADDLYWSNIKGLNLQFYKYTWGPYSKELNTNWSDLQCAQLVAEDEQFWITDQGFRFAEDFGREVLALEDNRLIRNTLDEVIARFGGMQTSALLDHVYGMRCYTLRDPGRRHLVKSIDKYTDMTAILDEDEADASLVVPDNWQLTIDLAMHPDALRNLNRGIEDTHEGRVYGLEALFANA